MAVLLFNDPEFMTDGEVQTAETLEKGLPARWSIICNKVLPTNRYSSREIDFIVIGERYVFAIDEKSWRGRITGSDTIWVRDDGSSTRSPLNKIEMVSKVLAGHIRNRVAHMMRADEFVLGCVSLTKSTERPSVTDPRVQSKVFLHSDICDRISQLDKDGGSPEVGTRRPRITESLHDLRARPQVPTRINDYTVIDKTPGLPGSWVCNARHVDGMERQLSMYRIRSNDPEARAFFLQQFHAYTELAQMGVCPDAQDPFTWSDDYLVVASSAPVGISLGAMKLPNDEAALVEELEKAAATFHALELVHDKGIIHRSIGPENIYLHHDGQSWKANLTGFYACRISRSPRASISPRLNELDIDNPYAAPELSQHGYEYADDTADTFSAGLTFLERITGRSVSDLLDATGLPTLTPTWPVWDVIDRDIMESFFNDTLGKEQAIGDPGPGKGRLSATQCKERVHEILLKLK